MLLFILICASVFLVLISFFVFKRITNPIFLIISWYVTGILVSHSGLFGMYKPEYLSSEFILINIIIICVSFLIVAITKSMHPIRIAEYSLSKFWEKLFSIARLITFILITVLSINLALSLITGKISVNSIRLIVYSLSYNSDAYTQIFFNKIIYNIFNFFLKGFILFDVSWNLCQVLLNNTKLRAISLINLFLYCFVILSRIEIMRIFIIFAIIIISTKYMKIKSRTEGVKAKSNYYKKILLYFAVVMIITFSFRTSLGESVVITSIKELIISLTGSYVVFGNYFSTYLNGLRLINSNSIAIFFGGLEPVSYTLLKIFGITLDLPTTILNEYISTGSNIGASDHYNAFYTMYYNFLSAGGIIGCLVISIIFGVLLGILYKSYLKNHNPESLLLYTFGLHIIILGSIRWELSTFSIWFMLILILLITKGGKK